jgi:uncharacterized protein (TIRG00374 family)
MVINTFLIQCIHGKDIQGEGSLVDNPTQELEQHGNARPQRAFRWIWLAWLLAPLLLWLAIRQAPLEGVWQAVLRLKVWQLAVLMGVNLLILSAQSGRLWLILRAFGQRVPFFSVMGCRLAGFALSYFTPGPQVGGEPLQVFLLKKKHGTPTTSGVASVFLDKVLEILANFTFLTLGLAVAALSNQAVGKVSPWFWLFLPLVAIIPALHLFLVLRGGQPLTQVLGRLQRRFHASWLGSAVEHAGHAEREIEIFYREKPSDFFQVIGLTVLDWALLIGEFTLILSFLGAAVSLGQAIVILTAARIAFLMPSPGGIGTLEASQVFALGAAGFNPGIGLAVSLVMRARDLSLGLAGLWIGGWDSR